MKRKIILVVCLVMAMCMEAWSQQPLYKLQVWIKESPASACTNRSWIQVEIQTDDLINSPNPNGLYQYGTDVSTWWDSSNDGTKLDRTFDGTKNISSITVRTQCYGRCRSPYNGLFYVRCGANNSFIYNKTYTDIANVHKQVAPRTPLFFPLSPGGLGVETYPMPVGNEGEEWVHVRMYPANLKIETTAGPTDNSGLVLLDNDRLTFNATAGFRTEDYTWKYQILDGSPIQDLPAQYQGQSSISFNGPELFANNGNLATFQNAVNNKRQIEITLWAVGPSVGLYRQGDPVAIIPKYNAPRIQSITPQKAKCFEDDKSSVVIKFDKPLCYQCKMVFTNNMHSITGGDPLLITSDSLNSKNEYVLKNVYLNTLPTVLNLPTESYDIALSSYFNGDGSSKAAQYYVKNKLYNYTLRARPLKLAMKLAKKDVLCFGGQDGELVGSAQGGTPPYALVYSNKITRSTYATHVQPSNDATTWKADSVAVTNLLPSDYKLIVTDVNGCRTSDSISLVQPATPLSLSASSVTEASGFGLSDGTFQVTLTGGTTENATQGYSLLTLKNAQGTLYTAQFVSKVNTAYTFRITNLLAGTYAFSAMDGNLSAYGASVRDSAGCRVAQTATIIQPPPLVALVEQPVSIRCYGDQSAQLIAHAQGGRPFLTSVPYTYQWSFSKDGIIAYVVLPFTDSILSNQAAGFFKVKVSDKNNNTVTTSYLVTQPTKVAYDVLVKNVTCLNWTDGAITLSNLRGGTAPYTVAWADGSSGLMVSALAHGTYLPTVSDALGCTTVSPIFVKDTLNGINIAVKLLQSPTCNTGADGSLAVTLNVERKPYTVLWNTGSSDTLLTNIKAGVYTVQVLNSNNCLKEASFFLPDPAPIFLDLPAERALCIGQHGDFDIEVRDSAYTYHWQGLDFESTTAQVSLVNEGKYTAEIQNSKGCTVKDSVKLYNVNRTIASQFVASGQVIAGDEVLLVNITPFELADTSVWVLNAADMDIVETKLAYAKVIFKKAGTYKIGLRSELGNCVLLDEKELMVFEPTFDHKPYSGSSSSFIKEFEVRPNPNKGQFEVMIRLQDITGVKIRLLDFYSKSGIIEIQQNDADYYLIPMNVDVADGTYILFLETAYGTRVTKLVILR